MPAGIDVGGSPERSFERSNEYTWIWLQKRIRIGRIRLWWRDIPCYTKRLPEIDLETLKVNILAGLNMPGKGRGPILTMERIIEDPDYRWAVQVGDSIVYQGEHAF